MATDERARGANADLWRFALALYARPGVAAALLALQDRSGHNVNLTLFALWLGAVCGRRLDPDMLAGASAVIAPVDDAIVRPMRGLRRRLKPAGERDLQRLRRRVLALELAAEREVLGRLAGFAADIAGTCEADRLAVASDNLALCLGDRADGPEGVLLRREVADLMRRRDRD